MCTYLASSHNQWHNLAPAAAAWPAQLSQRALQPGPHQGVAALGPGGPESERQVEEIGTENFQQPVNTHISPATAAIYSLTLAGTKAHARQNAEFGRQKVNFEYH